MNTRIKYTIYLQLLATKWFLKLRNTRENKKSEEEVRLGAEVFLAHFLFCLPCNSLFKKILNRFQISGIWLQTHFEIVENRLLVGFRRGDFLELHRAHRDLVATDRRQALNHVAHCPLSIFVGAVGGE